MNKYLQNSPFWPILPFYLFHDFEINFSPDYTGWGHESHQNIMGMDLAMDSDDKISKFSIGVAMAMLNASPVLSLLGKDTDSILLSNGRPSNIPSAILIQIFL